MADFDVKVNRPAGTATVAASCFCKYNVSMGRPIKGKDDSRGKLMQVRVQDREYEIFKEAADAAGLDLSGWVRARLRDAAIRDKKKYRDLSGGDET